VERETARLGAAPSKPRRTHKRATRAQRRRPPVDLDRHPRGHAGDAQYHLGEEARSAPGACPLRRATTTRRRPRDAGHEPDTVIGPAMGAAKRFAGSAATGTDPKRGMEDGRHTDCGLSVRPKGSRASPARGGASR